MPETGEQDAQIHDFYSAADRLRGTDWVEHPPTDRQSEFDPPKRHDSTITYEDVALVVIGSVHRLGQMMGIPRFRTPK